MLGAEMSVHRIPTPRCSDEESQTVKGLEGVYQARLDSRLEHITALWASGLVCV